MIIAVMYATLLVFANTMKTLEIALKYYSSRKAKAHIVGFHMTSLKFNENE